MPFKTLDGRSRANPAKPKTTMRSYSADDVAILQEYILYKCATTSWDPKDERQNLLLQLVEALRNERDLQWEEPGN